MISYKLLKLYFLLGVDMSMMFSSVCGGSCFGDFRAAYKVRF